MKRINYYAQTESKPVKKAFYLSADAYHKLLEKASEGGVSASRMLTIILESCCNPE